MFFRLIESMLWWYISLLCRRAVHSGDRKWDTNCLSWC